MSENFKHTHLDTLKRACDTLTGGTQVQVMFFRPVYFCVTIYAFFFFYKCNVEKEQFHFCVH